MKSFIKVVSVATVLGLALPIGSYASPSGPSVNASPNNNAGGAQVTNSKSSLSQNFGYGTYSLQTQTHTNTTPNGMTNTITKQTTTMDMPEGGQIVDYSQSSFTHTVTP